MIRNAIRPTCLLAGLLLLAPLAARAQFHDAGQMRAGSRYVGMWVGGSWTAVGPSFSSIPTKPYAILSARVEYVLESKGWLALAFFMEAMPAIVVQNVPHYHIVDTWQPPSGPMRRRKIWDLSGPVYGFGITPVGMQYYLAIAPKVRAFVNMSGGVSWFTRDMPVPDSKQINFLGDLGAGLRISRGSGGIIVGMKFHHMSNANQGHQNPGIDGNVVYAGLMRAR